MINFGRNVLALFTPHSAPAYLAAAAALLLYRKTRRALYQKHGEHAFGSSRWFLRKIFMKNTLIFLLLM